MESNLIIYTATKMMEIDKTPATITYAPKKDNSGTNIYIEGSPFAVFAGVMRVCIAIAKMYDISFDGLLEILKLNYDRTPHWG
ncbi:MAG: hypothetical protein EOM76_12915, partial [Sphingobacteriia bacterium]|nr:hypothetical protein [Sphingobacteriia bacterium]